jgi:iron complex transport system ATP-binding protein
MTALRFDSVAVSLAGRPVLCGVDFELREGEVMVLAGRNGAGKTTLLRIATRILAPDAGEVRIDGRSLASHGRRELARVVALVPQETSVPFPFSVAEVVLMGRAPHLGLLGFESKRDLGIARAAMERLGIDHLADRSILEVSGGERQLAMVARALAQEARILLLDEPTAHLDVNRRLEVLALVRELAGEGRSALVVSHDLGLAARDCDRVALLCEGRILAAGPPAEVLEPALLRRAFGVEAEVLHCADGSAVVVPRRPRAPRS